MRIRTFLGILLALAAVAFGYLALARPAALPAAAPVLAPWFAAPIITWHASRPLARRGVRLTADQLRFLGGIARKTWGFFDAYVGPGDNWLPPDNFQESPALGVAHRTSPTNMGLALLANLSAYDFGYISAGNLVDRTGRAFEAMSSMERHRGHFYNWYDTQSLAPLEPRYISTVDSGNLAPAALMLWGISFIINKDFIKVVFAGVIAIVLALTIFGAGQSFLNIFDKDIDFEFADGENHVYADTTRYVESFDKKIKNVDLKIDAGAGSFNIVEPTSDLISVLALGIKDNYIFTRNDSESGTSIEVKMKKTKIKLRKGSFKNKIEMNLNSEPIWNMNFDIGAAAIDFDLAPYKVSTMKLDMGAASLDLKLGDKYPETIVDVDAGASSIDILVPDSSGCG